MNALIQIGVDTGGTFTDFIVYRNGKIEIKKILSTPDDPSQAIIAGLRDFIRSRPALKIHHGTTVATNALLERKGGRIVLLTTKGFEDVIFIRRQIRKDLYRLRGEERTPLLDPGRSLGMDERTSYDGCIERQISAAEMERCLAKIKKLRAEAVAVCFIHSYANPANEKKLTEFIQKAGIPVSRSSAILPEYREYERTTVTAVNAYLMPVISRYLTRLEEKLSGARLRIMQSNEGHISPETARKEPIRTALSGPAGGVVAAHHLGHLSGFPQLVTFDMGGTSSDVSLVDKTIRWTHENTIGEFPIRLPIIDIHTVGSGGGSLAYADKGGSLRVGPESAGADPGPACYGKGENPTVTDANLVLGRLDPDFFLGGRMRLYPEKSYAAIARLGENINKSPLETAAGIIAIANANMEKAIRVISIEKGIDVRRFALFSFGGAGGMHAVEMASHLHMPKVMIPKNAGVLSALGLVLADSIKDYSQSVLKKSDSIGEEDIESLFQRMIRQGHHDMKEEGFSENRVEFNPFIDMRYFGQSFEISIPYTGWRNTIAAFHQTHFRLYAYNHPGQPVEIVNLRVKTVGKTEKIQLAEYQPEGGDPSPALAKHQSIIFQHRKHKAPVYIRSRLKCGNRIKGPALIVDIDSTTFLPPGYDLNTDRFLNLIIQQEGHND
jgi:N-methylhydantoinase A/oxoprolinase/acetone carboxylase beta subunit